MMVKGAGVLSEVTKLHSGHVAKLCERESEVTQSCPTLCDPMDCSLPGSSVHGIFHARILEWVAISFSIERLKPSKLDVVLNG